EILERGRALPDGSHHVTEVLDHIRDLLVLVGEDRRQRLAVVDQRGEPAERVVEVLPLTTDTVARSLEELANARLVRRRERVEDLVDLGVGLVLLDSDA